jgi:catechol 2,3-dioxygenase-like lactoylglutathione lyase family enzyme
VDERGDGPGSLGRRGVPSFMAHFVIRTSRYAEVLEWYRQVFQAETIFYSEQGAFLSFDQEHHRVAIIHIPGLGAQSETTAGVDHVAFTLASLEELLDVYERLQRVGIRPFWCINHGPTTSMYFKDPDGTGVELQVDNFATKDEARAVFRSEAFARNPVGVEFDPEVLIGKLRAGVAVADLLRQGSAPIAGKATST